MSTHTIIGGTHYRVKAKVCAGNFLLIQECWCAHFSGGRKITQQFPKGPIFLFLKSSSDTFLSILLDDPPSIINIQLILYIYVCQTYFSLKKGFVGAILICWCNNNLLQGSKRILSAKTKLAIESHISTLHLVKSIFSCPSSCSLTDG